MYRCQTCESPEVEGAYWVNHNTCAIESVVESIEESWCQNCEEYCKIYDDDTD